MSERERTTRLLDELRPDDPASVEQLFSIVYDELRAIAGGCFREQRPDHTLQPTALVNEVFLRLVDRTRIEWKSRAHFLAVSARAMRQILIDHARGRARVKRGGNLYRVTMAEGITPITDVDPELIGLDEALQKLAGLHERQSRIVEMRFFGGMTVKEVAHVLGQSVTTVETDWRMARAWLRRELSDEETP